VDRSDRLAQTIARVFRCPVQHPLRVGGFRVFYDDSAEAVLVNQVLSKQESIDYLGGPP
jgi:hypothetical protein